MGHRLRTTAGHTVIGSARGTQVRPASKRLRDIRTTPLQQTKKGEVMTTKAGTKPDMGG